MYSNVKPRTNTSIYCTNLIGGLKNFVRGMSRISCLVIMLPFSIFLPVWCAKYVYDKNLVLSRNVTKHLTPTEFYTHAVVNRIEVMEWFQWLFLSFIGVRFRIYFKTRSLRNKQLIWWRFIRPQLESKNKPYFVTTSFTWN